MVKNSRGKALFDLVKSLNSKELRHFKLYTSGFAKGGDRQYQVVFDFMCAQHVWSEQALRDILAQQGLVVQLNVVYLYLHRKILESLRKYDTLKSFELIANRYLDEIAVLHKRGLQDYCLIQIKKARKYAQKMDLPHMELQLLQWELRLLRGKAHPQNWKRIAELAASAAQLERKVQLETAMLALYSRIFAIRNWPAKVLPKDREKEVRLVAQDPAMQVDPSAMGFDAALLYHNIQGILALEKGDARQFARANSHKVALWKQNYDRQQAEPVRYFKGLFSEAESSVEIGMFEYADKSITAIKQDFFEKNISLEKVYGLLVLHLQLRMFMSWGKLKEAMACAEGIPEYDDIEPGEARQRYPDICANAAYVFFMAGIWSRCLEFIAKAEVLTKRGARMEFIQKALPLRLMAMYAAGDEGLEGAVKAWSRVAGETPMASLLTEVFQSLAQADDETSVKADLTRLLNGLDDFPLGDAIRKLMHNWTLARLQGRPMRDFYPDAQP